MMIMMVDVVYVVAAVVVVCFCFVGEDIFLSAIVARSYYYPLFGKRARAPSPKPRKRT